MLITCPSKWHMPDPGHGMTTCAKNGGIAPLPGGRAQPLDGRVPLGVGGPDPLGWLTVACGPAHVLLRPAPPCLPATTVAASRCAVCQAVAAARRPATRGYPLPNLG
jgi:hypothetical protein